MVLRSACAKYFQISYLGRALNLPLKFGTVQKNKNKFLPMRGIEPSVSAWQAIILTTTPAQHWWKKTRNFYLFSSLPKVNNEGNILLISATRHQVWTVSTKSWAKIIPTDELIWACWSEDSPDVCFECLLSYYLRIATCLMTSLFVPVFHIKYLN